MAAFKKIQTSAENDAFCPRPHGERTAFDPARDYCNDSGQSRKARIERDTLPYREAEGKRLITGNGRRTGSSFGGGCERHHSRRVKGRQLLQIMDAYSNKESLVRDIAEKLIDTDYTIRQLAGAYHISKSYIGVLLRSGYVPAELRADVDAILCRHAAEKHIRGGRSTKRKYEMLHTVDHRKNMTGRKRRNA